MRTVPRDQRRLHARQAAAVALPRLHTAGIGPIRAGRTVMAATVTTPPAELVQFARAQVGEFAERYRAILRRAFSAHTLVLNGKQLRDLAGGGSQTTAQRAIDEFRAELAAQFSHRVRLGADVPQPLISGATDLLEKLWVLARDEAGQQFDEDRRHLQAQADQASARSMELEAAREQQARELAARNADLASARDALTRQTHELAQARSSLEAEVQARQQDHARHQAQCAQLEQFGQRVRDDLQQQLAQMTQLRDGLQKTLETERRDAGHRFDRLLIEHREALGASRAETHVLREKLQAAVEHSTRLEARLEAREAASTQEIQRLQEVERHLQAAERQLQAKVDELQAQAQQAQAQALASQERLISVLEREGRADLP